jgi:NTP pyrophosphatase (non-canonical NTP hydrolase)
LGFNHRLNSWSLSDWMTATLGELGEAANVAKKLNRVRDGIPGNKGLTEAQLKEMFAAELADAFIYLDLMAQSQGIDLAEAAVEKFNAKSREIGYPVVLDELADLSSKLAQDRARLNEAAPDLLTACEALLDSFASLLSLYDEAESPEDKAVIKLAREAIAKATGATQ